MWNKLLAATRSSAALLQQHPVRFEILSLNVAFLSQLI
jgi:hypothetical protein